MSKGKTTSSIPDHTRPGQDKENLPALELASPEARVEVGRSARQRQYQKSPPKSLRDFEVAYNGDKARVKAIDENEAWAIYCDGRKTWPSPIHRTIRELSPEELATAPAAIEVAALPSPDDRLAASGGEAGQTLQDI